MYLRTTNTNDYKLDIYKFHSKNVVFEPKQMV